MNKLKDHLGNEYKDIEELAGAYNLPPYIVKSRLRSGYTMEEALTKKYAGYNQPHYDHNGTKFSTLKEMCKYYGISEANYLVRLRNGWSMKNALTIPVRGQACVDHEGTRFSSMAKMADYWGIPYETFYRRYKVQGKSLEEALTLDYEQVIDHLGNKFRTKIEMCRYHDISYSTFITRKSKGWSLKDCLTKRVQGRARKLVRSKGINYF